MIKKKKESRLNNYSIFQSKLHVRFKYYPIFMKTNTKPATNDYVTKKDLKDALEIQSKEINLIRSDLNQTIKEQTRDFAKVVNDMLIDVGIKFDKQDSKIEKIDQRFEQVDRRFDQVDSKFEQLNKKINENREVIISSIKKELLNSNLQIIDELRASREGQPILEYKQRKHTDQFKDHDLRISNIEENFSVV